jgi:DNA-directed RNA polymerase subunit RPC12/RpoP
MKYEDQLLASLFVGETVTTIKEKLGLSVNEINNSLINTDLVVCPNCQIIQSINGLIGDLTNNCPICNSKVLKV